MAEQINEHPIIDYSHGRTVHFLFDGAEMTGFEDEPIASALLRNGISVFRTTEKRKEPRGLFCGIGQCSDCVVIVDGCPNTRSCITPLKEGMTVETQHGLGKAAII